MNPSRRNRAIAWVPEYMFSRITRGIVLPDGYYVVDKLPFTSHSRLAFGVLIESEELPETLDGYEYPSLAVEDGYDAIVVRRWGQ